jgi:hypothetical protein
MTLVYSIDDGDYDMSIYGYCETICVAWCGKEDAMEHAEQSEGLENSAILGLDVAVYKLLGTGYV